MNIQTLSSKYDVRVLTEEDADIILELFLSNPTYFEYCPPSPSVEQT